MANYNLTNQEIKDSFQQLVQVSSSLSPGEKNYLLDGTGSLVPSLDLTSSLATSASHALLADSTLSATSASHAVIADSSLTASIR